MTETGDVADAAGARTRSRSLTTQTREGGNELTAAQPEGASESGRTQ